MILSALCEYYDRSQGNLAPKGKERRELKYIIVIDQDGNFSRLEDCQIEKKKYHKFLIPKGVSRTSATKSNSLWDNCSYALGLSEETFLRQRSAEEEKKVRNNISHYAAFVDEAERIAIMNPESADLKTLLLFLHQSEDVRLAALQNDTLWDEFRKSIKTANISFRIEGRKTIIAEQDFKMSDAAESASGEGATAICLVTGNRAEPVQTTSATPIIGGQATAKIVAFQVNSGYDSYGKSQCANAPISTEAEFKYSTALRTLLAKDSKNKAFIGVRTFVFWASKETEAATDVEDSIFSIFSESGTDDPNAHVNRVKNALRAMFSGERMPELGDKFYFLGLAPNAARIAVVYWQETTLGNFAANILRHFDDMEVVDTSKNPRPYFGIYPMLRAVTLDGKVDKALPSLPEAIMKSVLSGGRYPRLLLTSCIARIRAEASDKDVKYPVSVARAAILKAYINRLNDNNKKIDIMLDKENTNPAYLCGRLFAVLESIQYSASGLRSIAERYLNSASTTPAYVFPTLLNLSLHHSEKAGWGEGVKAEIINMLPPDGFPVHLDVEDQGRFFLGYYQQKASRMVDGVKDGAETRD